MLNSCNDKNIDNDDSGDKIIRFRVKALELGSNAVTKLDVENCKFENGDEIGLFAVKRKIGNTSLSNNELNSTSNFIHNARLIYDGNNSWISDPPIYYPEDRTTASIDFYAYYPYREFMDPNNMDISGGVLTNQEGRSTLGESDFMTAYKRDYVFDGEKEVELVFRHHFSLVRLECQTTVSPVFNSVAIFTPKYSVNKFELIPVATGSKDLTYSLIYESDKVKKIAIGMHSKENAVKIYEALVIPQIIEKGQNAPLFYFFNDENSSFFSIFLEDVIDNEKQIELSKGNIYTFLY
jgi:hypothetical protein